MTSHIYLIPKVGNQNMRVIVDEAQAAQNLIAIE